MKKKRKSAKKKLSQKDSKRKPGRKVFEGNDISFAKPQESSKRTLLPGKISRRKILVVLVCILLLGGLLRLLYLHERAGQPDFRFPIVDADFHNYWARGLAFGEWTPPRKRADPHIRTSPYFRPPGYPYFLALVYKLTGRGYLWPRIIQLFFGLFNVLLAYWLARRWFGTSVGLILAGFMAVYWAFIYFEGEFHAAVLVSGLILAGIQVLALWTRRITFLRALAAGLLLGLAALMRPTCLLFFPAALIWAFSLVKPVKNWRGLGTAFLGLLLGASMTVLPVTIRNYVVADEFVLISSNGGINLYIGNNEKADGVCTTKIADLGVFSTCYDYPQLKANLEKKLGRPITHSEFSSILTKKAVQFILTHPGKALGLTLRKALLVLGPSEVSHNKVVQMDRENSGVLSRIPVNFPAVLTFALLGILLLWVEVRRVRDRDGNLTVDLQERWQVSKLIIWMVLAWFISMLPFFAAARYRVPIIPLLLLFAAYAFFQIRNLVKNRDFKRAAVWAALGIALFLVTSINFVGYKIDKATWHYARGCNYVEGQKLDLALDELKKAVEIDPNNPHAHIDLGVILSIQGKYDESIWHSTQALRIRPDLPIIHYNLGSAYSGKGELDRSIYHFNETLRLDPNFRGAREALQRMKAAKARWFR